MRLGNNTAGNNGTLGRQYSYLWQGGALTDKQEARHSAAVGTLLAAVGVI